MSQTLIPLLGIFVPSLELVVVCLFGTLLPSVFFVWLNWWLSSVPEENPDDAIAAQAKADAAHHAQHGRAHGAGHGHAHA